MTIDVNGEFKTSMKSKRMPKKFLQSTWHDLQQTQKTEFGGLRKINERLAKPDAEKGYSYFSIVSENKNRTFCKTEWEGMKLKDNIFYPQDYNSDYKPSKSKLYVICSKFANYYIFCSK